MNYLNIDYSLTYTPKLDPSFIPFGVWRKAFLTGASAQGHPPKKITVYK